jgi:multidrug efflux system membrane fusion protein
MTDPLFIRSRPRWWYVLAILVAGALIWYFMSRGQAARAGGPAARGAGQSQPTPVRTVTAEIKPLPVYLKAIGTVTPLNAVTVKSRVDGELLRIAFQEGERVERGQLLAEIDPVSYRIRLAQAEGQMQQSAAQVEIARSDLERLRNLHGQKLVTNQELERQQALVAERAGALAAMQGQVDDARLQLGYTRVEAPIGGRVGLRRVDAGNLVHASDPNGIVSIVQTQPIAVGFTLPEADLPAVLDSLRAGETLPVEAWDRGEGSVLAAGILRTVDNQIDTATGTVRLKAEFSNDDDRLFPNQFVNVRMRVRTLDRAVVIHAAAVQFGSRGTYVYVVNPENKAEVRDIVLGPANGTEQAVVSGLKGGEAVVLEGLERLREGGAVIVANGSGPSAKRSP